MDKLRKTSNIPPTTLSASISDTDTTIPLSSTVGAETSTCIDIVIDRIDAAGEKTPDKMEVVTVLISGNNGTNAVRGRTAPAMPHEQGAVVEYNISTSVLHNDLIDGVSSILTLEGKPKEKSIPLNSINGGTKSGVLVVEDDGKTTVGKIKSENIDFTSLISRTLKPSDIISETLSLGNGLSTTLCRIGSLVFASVEGTGSLNIGSGSVGAKLPAKYRPDSRLKTTNIVLTALNSGRLNGHAVLRLYPSGNITYAASSSFNEWYGSGVWYTTQPIDATD